MHGLQWFSKKSNILYCYGIGKWGTYVAQYCKKKHIKVSAYVTTQKPFPGELFHGTPIIWIYDLHLSKQDGVIIATERDDYKEEMKSQVIGQLATFKNFFYADKSSCVARFQYNRFKKEILRRKKINVFSFKRLSQKLPYMTFGVVRDMDSRFAYGCGKYVRKYIKVHKYDLEQCTIQHGIALGGISIDYANPPDNNIFAMAGVEWRRLTYCNIYCLGPYIRYAKPIITKKRIDRLKNKMGRTLLVVPCHGNVGSNVNFDIDYFIREIERIREKGKFDSVLVCLYYVDIWNGNYKKYLVNNYRIVTSGHHEDQFFLNRLKVFLLVSDQIITNGFGTHIGYGISMGKPVYYFPMDVIDEGELAREAGSYKMFNPYEEYAANRKAFMDCFQGYREYITSKQVELVKKYWGDWNRRKGLIPYKHD